MAISDKPDPNARAVYAAEHELIRNNPDTLGREVKLHEAWRLSKHIINHPDLDDVPGIDKARKSLMTKVSLRSNIITKVAPGTIGATSMAGNTFYAKDRPITVGTVSHETVHKILAHAEEPALHGPQFTALHEKVMKAVFNERGAGIRGAYNKHGAE